MRPHRQLVHQDRRPAAPVDSLEQLDGEDPGHPELAGDPERELLRLAGQGGVEVGRRRDHLVADAVELGAGDDGVRRRLAARRARHQRGELAPEVDQLLGQQPDSGALGDGERLGDVVGVRTTQTPLPS